MDQGNLVRECTGKAHEEGRAFSLKSGCTRKSSPFGPVWLRQVPSGGVSDILRYPSRTVNCFRDYRRVVVIKCNTALEMGYRRLMDQVLVASLVITSGILIYVVYLSCGSNVLSTLLNLNRTVLTYLQLSYCAALEIAINH